MNIRFTDKKLEKVANNFKLLQKAFGTICAKIIRRRLDDLDAADTLEDMRYLPGKCHELRENRKGQLAVDVEQPDRLIFAPDHDPIPTTENGALNWASVNSIVIIEITNYHGK